MRKGLASEILEMRYESRSSADKVEDKYSNEKHCTIPLQENEEHKIIGQLGCVQTTYLLKLVTHPALQTRQHPITGLV